jgi:uncharacterized membrane protein
MDAELSSPPNRPDKSAELDRTDSAEVSVKCPRCGAVVASDAAFCPDCKWPMTPLSLAERTVAAVAYLPLIPPAVILFLPEFRRNRFVRFHAWQSISLWLVFFVLIGVTVLLSNIASPMAVLLFGILTSLAMLFLWVVLSIKALQGERLELPLFGLWAARMK